MASQSHVQVWQDKDRFYDNLSRDLFDDVKLRPVGALHTNTAMR